MVCYTIREQATHAGQFRAIRAHLLLFASVGAVRPAHFRQWSREIVSICRPRCGATQRTTQISMIWECPSNPESDTELPLAKNCECVVALPSNAHIGTQPRRVRFVQIVSNRPLYLVNQPQSQKATIKNVSTRPFAVAPN